MAKRKKISPPSLVPSTEKTEVIPKDLMDQWGAVQACSTAFSVLDKGYFPHNYAGVVKQSLQFLAKLHEQTVEAALKHPQAHMISELKELATQKKTQEAPNGQVSKDN